VGEYGQSHRCHVNAAAISAKPQHPNAAKLLYDFLLSGPAQQRLRSLRRIPARPDIEPFSPRMDQSKLKLQVEPSQTGPQFNQTIKEFREIFGM
jgi:ABC-type Fe3+ transport system substrate-binding protein